MENKFDILVIGAGPGGYIAAIRAAQLGKKVACVDMWTDDAGKPKPGGTCTNVGCIPSKALLQSSEHFEQANHHFAEHGISVSDVKMDVTKMISRKETVVKQNNEGILFLFKKNKVSFFSGKASFTEKSDAGFKVKVEGKDAAEVTAEIVIVATGSDPRPLPNLPFDEKTVLSNTGALDIPEVPKKLGIIGAGVIGLELGSVWRRLGADVTILEAAPAFLTAADEAIAKEAKKAFDKQGLKIDVGVKITEAKNDGKSVKIAYDTAGGEKQELTVDKLIVSIGRIPFTSGLNLEAVGVKLDDRGFIEVDENCRTSVQNIWAIGDVVRGPMLAHKAEEEGVAVAERIAGMHAHVDFGTIPSVIYTSPEIAWVGKTEKQLKDEGRKVKSGQFPFMANGRARAMGDITGFAKIIADAETDEVLGGHIIGPMASELISELVTIMEFKGAAEDIARICHAHPTLSEAIKEAALAVDKRTLNL
ncbi:2-oxoglutarate dehydrogenase complex, E3 [Taylorella asinigenitalis 14/45]|uniref:Dihydrolipoyl dehydrogenase n=1 Tax=Taylorella asinigenitalis 14/45 TaxID=1091495 RepID=I7J106_9BURK|nr:dihydrolipoyl dehydrogenase [Taylorella asinigenitalis]CCG19261.1 2-oxoglutarate dehydrogenase complex, E3 [Taylorella asinigenitalis 14/45]